MKKSLILLFLIVFSINLSAQETQWYAIIGYTTNSYHKGFDCKTNKINRILLATPIPIPQPDIMVKHNLKYQFLDWAYDNKKEILDKVAKHIMAG